MIDKEELISIVGGTTLSGSLINALSRIIGATLEAGRSLGSAIRRAKTGNLCPA